MTKANVKNAADAKQVKKGGKLEREARRQELLDIKNVMQTESGKRLLWRILHEFCHIDLKSADMRSGSATYFNEGAREVGLALKSDLYEGAFEEYQMMENDWYITNINTELTEEEPEGKE